MLRKLTGADLFRIFEVEEPEMQEVFDLYLIAEMTGNAFDDVLDWTQAETDKYSTELTNQMSEYGEVTEKDGALEIKLSTPGFSTVIVREPINRDRLGIRAMTMRKMKFMIAWKCSGLDSEAFSKLGIGDIMNIQDSLNFFTGTPLSELG